MYPLGSWARDPLNARQITAHVTFAWCKEWIILSHTPFGVQQWKIVKNSWQLSLTYTETGILIQQRIGRADRNKKGDAIPEARHHNYSQGIEERLQLLSARRKIALPYNVVFRSCLISLQPQEKTVSKRSRLTMRFRSMQARIFSDEWILDYMHAYLAIFSVVLHAYKFLIFEQCFANETEFVNNTIMQ